MSAAVVFDGPQPPPGRWFCFVCAFSAKAYANAQFSGEISAAEHEPDGSPPITLKIPHYIAGLPDGKPQLAVGYGVYPPLAQFGVLPLCWSHLGGIAVTSVLPATSLPPGLGGGGQVPLLGQGR